MDQQNADQKLAELNLTLPPAPKPVGVYKPFLIVGNMIYVSGHSPVLPEGGHILGKVGRDMDADQGKSAARQVGKAIIATLLENLGSLNKISRVVKVLGMVNATPDFGRHPYVINGCSELFAEIFGPDHGVGVRSAVGFGSLPHGIPVEIEAQFELK